MFENLTHLELQQYWWVIVSLLGSILVFMMFVQGGQMLINQIGKTKNERTMLINAVGRKWDLTFTTLVTFGGAFFASFPLFYSTSFSGAYWIWLLILFSFIIQAVSYEYRTKPNNFLGEKTFNTFLFINGVLATTLIGIVVGTFFTGSEFSIEKLRITNLNNPVISQWEASTRGLEAVWNIFNLSLGLSIFFLSRLLGALYFINTIENEKLVNNAVKQMKINIVPFLFVFLLFVGLLLTKQGFAVDPDTGIILIEKHKYFNNLIQMPVVLIILLIGVIGIIGGFYITIFRKSRKGIWISGLGAISTVFAVFLVAGFTYTAYYPSTYDLQSSLTIQNSSSSHYTLTVMSYVSLLVPFVILYIAYAWKSMNVRRISEEEMNEEEHKY